MQLLSQLFVKYVGSHDYALKDGKAPVQNVDIGQARVAFHYNQLERRDKRQVREIFVTQSEVGDE